MTKTIAIEDTESAIRQRMGNRTERSETLIIEANGEPVAVLMSPERYRALAYDRFWSTIDQIGIRNEHLDPDEVLADITELVDEVRRERRASAE